ncbi:MAG: ABC transporter substrate-binding protein [Gammaproteobacteria bacterium]|nr:MAG: ABC transporter substrate-binding protein [Gammaproteobacteria bacterium]
MGVLLLVLSSTAVSGTDAPGEATAPPLRFGITAVFLLDQQDLLERWQSYLEHRLHRPVVFVRRKSYTEISDLLLNGQLDAAWICSLPYVLHHERLHLLATPVFRGEPLYQSYLIVPDTDRDTDGYQDLRGKVFAYVDPRSNTGYLYPRHVLRLQRSNDQAFFRKTLFTWSHPDVVRAVAERLADAGAVDGYIWEAMQQRYPEITHRTRVVARSEKFGFPPIVASDRIDPSLEKALQAILLTMHQDPNGKQLLGALLLDRMITPSPSIYQRVAQIAQASSIEGESR